MPNTSTLSARLQPVFQKTKTVCFGRFMVDVPASATIAWGEADIPLGITVYRGGVAQVKEQAKDFIGRLESGKAIYLKDVPLLISVDKVEQPEGEIVAGYEDFQSIKDIKINGYFKFYEDGLVLQARPLMDSKDKVIADIKASPSVCERTARPRSLQSPATVSSMPSCLIGQEMKKRNRASTSVLAFA